MNVMYEFFSFAYTFLSSVQFLVDVELHVQIRLY